MVVVVALLLLLMMSGSMGMICVCRTAGGPPISDLGPPRSYSMLFLFGLMVKGRRQVVNVANERLVGRHARSHGLCWLQGNEEGDGNWMVVGWVGILSRVPEVRALNVV